MRSSRSARTSGFRVRQRRRQLAGGPPLVARPAEFRRRKIEASTSTGKSSNEGPRPGKRGVDSQSRRRPVCRRQSRPTGKGGFTLGDDIPARVVTVVVVSAARCHDSGGERESLSGRGRFRSRDRGADTRSRGNHCEAKHAHAGASACGLSRRDEDGLDETADEDEDNNQQPVQQLAGGVAARAILLTVHAGRSATRTRSRRRELWSAAAQSSRRPAVSVLVDSAHHGHCGQSCWVGGAPSRKLKQRLLRRNRHRPCGRSRASSRRSCRSSGTASRWRAECPAA